MSTSTGTITSSAGPLDVQSLVGKIMSAEGTALEPLNKQASSYNSLISAYGGLKSAISTYQTALNGLSANSFGAQKATVANNGATGTPTTDPLTADVTPDDSTKALPQKLQTGAFPPTASFKAGDSLAIKVGNNPPKFLTLHSNQNLTGLRDAINDGSLGVSATIVAGKTGDHLVITSNTAGSAGAVKIQANNSLIPLSYDSATPAANGLLQTQGPRDASTAASGTYTVAISQLAQAQKITSASFPDGAMFDTGVLAIKTGKGSTNIIHPTSNSLSGIRDAINAADTGVTATIVGGENAQHLVITANEPGLENTIRVTGTGSYSALNFDPSGNYTSAGITLGQTFDGNAGDLSLNINGTTTSVPLSGENMSLADVRDAINKSGSGVTATISNDGTQDHLVLAGTGKNASSPVSVRGTGDFADFSGTSMGQLSAAKDAKLSIDGVAVSSASNKVLNAIPGVTLNLTKVTTDSDNVTLTVGNDTSGLSKTADTFVSAYNTLVKAATDMTKQSPATELGKEGKSGPLASETAVQSMLSQLRNALFTPVSGGKGIATLSDVGISVQKDGTLSVDAAKLSAAANKNFAGVTNLFTAGATTNPDGTLATPPADAGKSDDIKDKGVLTRLKSLVNGFVTDGGIIDTKTKGLQASLRVNSDRQAAINRRLSTMQDSYTNQFNKLNGTLSSMATTQSYLTQQLASLQKSNQ
ncbi:flagellar hook-associated protein 2 [Herbaspirillum sp. Sphag1AN]|uniref:flagellar filament capping protein FliD n=1 Tax=unclassified Herbaspirillum TaxID=2624150 RepID=UPI0016072A4F|nr:MULTISPECIES: flagellar filament capping protein FliD [unclassified Herbaspirillum]MBB3211006.1 flagellar hook-associated protein 2 [Herbaspirillum sp. Sphag1AN]MBB3244635.1 flagellar hook-associated protein 2 [Herbaspirillum sp. Sphag64]